MKDRPILFSAPMVRALLAGTKTQTRRAVKEPGWATPHTLDLFNGMPWASDPLKGDREVPCPYGFPKDRLWVRENGWQRPERTARQMREGADTWSPYAYDADGIDLEDAEIYKAQGWRRRPSIHMPRIHSRITLEVTAVRGERLQDITETDAMAEGVNWKDHAGLANYTARKLYKQIWLSINGLESWEANPLVWVVEFRRTEPQYGRQSEGK